jgi:hypothetical protein
LRRDSGRFVIYCLLTAILALSYAWIVHFPTDYTRPAQYLPLVVCPAIGVAWARLLPRLTVVSAVAIGVVALQANNLAPALRSYYAYTNHESLAGLAYVEARTQPNDAIATDTCWGFLSTWLLRRPILAAQDPAYILPKWEAGPAQVGAEILKGGPTGTRLARRLGVRFVLVDPQCTYQRSESALPVQLGRRAFASRRLVVFDLSTTSTDRSRQVAARGHK